MGSFRFSTLQTFLTVAEPVENGALVALVSDCQRAVEASCTWGEYRIEVTYCPCLYFLESRLDTE